MKPGDVVVGAFPGAHLTKTRPAVVLSTDTYHQHRPDVVLGLITTKVLDIPSPTDCVLKDWKAAGFRVPSCFRLFLVTIPQANVRAIGRLTPSDWNEVVARCEIGLIGQRR